jgi:XTP/dITP diphosphohydrolase
MQIGFLSTNRHKCDETQACLEALLSGLALNVVQVVPQNDVEENGATFEDNARIKLEAGLVELGDARDAYDVLIAEDAGLVIPSLDGQYGLSPFPGVRSNRWLTPERQQTLLGDIVFSSRYGAINAGILSLMAGNPQREAYYASAMAFWQQKDNAIHVFEGRLAIRVGTEALGEGGFGYDPIMHLASYPDVTMTKQSIAECPAAVKNAVSHRRQALAQWVTHIENALV